MQERKLITFLFQNQNTENKIRQNFHKMSSYSTLNNEHSTRLVQQRSPNELSDDNREKIILLMTLAILNDRRSIKQIMSE